MYYYICIIIYNLCYILYTYIISLMRFRNSWKAFYIPNKI